MRKTKIVCTMGPATDNPEVLRELMGHAEFETTDL